MLERVPLLERDLDAYREIVGDEVVARIHELAEPLRGARVLHINATAYGGGVAELLATHVPLLCSAGLDAEWQVIRGSDDFFRITKSVHNALQGAKVEWTRPMEAGYLEWVLDNALRLEGEFDFVVVHDPQPAALRSFVRDRALRHEGTRWIWRCHIDLTEADPDVWSFYRPFVELHDAAVFTMPEFVPESLAMERVVQAPPCIDPLSVKNLDLPQPFGEELLKQYGVDVHRPIVCQVSRYDPWKDPLGVIEAWQIVRRSYPGLQLALVGSMAHDDPEGWEYYTRTVEAAGGDPDIFILSNLNNVGSVEVNAFQVHSAVVVQKSIREGFGLTVTEALWKAKPVVAGRVGGIVDQIQDGETGFLVDTVEECAEAVMRVLDDPVRARAMALRGKEYVRGHFLMPRLVRDWLALFSRLDGKDTAGAELVVAGETA